MGRARVSLAAMERAAATTAVVEVVVDAVKQKSVLPITPAVPPTAPVKSAVVMAVVVSAGRALMRYRTVSREYASHRVSPIVMGKPAVMMGAVVFVVAATPRPLFASKGNAKRCVPTAASPARCISLRVPSPWLAQSPTYHLSHRSQFRTSYTAINVLSSPSVRRLMSHPPT